MAEGVSIELDISGIKDLLDTHSGIQKMIDAAQAAGKIPGAGNPRGAGGMSDSQRGAYQAAQDRISNSQRIRQQKASSQAQRDADAMARQQEAEARRRRRSVLGGGVWDDYLTKATKLARAAFFVREALQTISRPFEEAAQASRALNSAMLSAGGGSGLSGFDAALGRAPGSFAGSAGAFRDRLSSDPFAAMAFGGIVPPAAYGGNQDNTLYLRRAIEKLANIQDENNRLLQARRMGLEEFLPITYASPESRARLANDAKLSEAQAKANRGTEGEIGAYQGSTSANLQRAYNNTAEFRLGLARIAYTFSYMATGLQRTFGGDVKGGFKEFWTGPDKAKTSPQEQAMDANTRALNALSGALKTTGMTIGGPRTQGAIPGALRSLELERNFEADKVRLGGAVVR